MVATAQPAPHISWNTYLEKLHNVTLLKQLLNSSLYENAFPAAMISLIEVFCSIIWSLLSIYKEKGEQKLYVNSLKIVCKFKII